MDAPPNSVARILQLNPTPRLAPGMYIHSSRIAIHTPHAWRIGVSSNRATDRCPTAFSIDKCQGKEMGGATLDLAFRKGDERDRGPWSSQFAS